MKPYIHAQNSVKKFGGKPEDYLKIHDWFDESKAHFADARHRALRHHTQGIFEAERVFGTVIKNSDGKDVCVRDIGEQHVIEDLGFIPNLSDYLSLIEFKEWMQGKDVPQSLKLRGESEQDKLTKQLLEAINKYRDKIDKEPVPRDIYPRPEPYNPPANPRTPLDDYWRDRVID